PLDTVANTLYLAHQKTRDQPDVRQLIETAQTETRRVAQISRNMLSLQRESSASAAVRLSEVLNEVVSLIDETIAKGRRRMQVISEFTGEVDGFASELRQVFTNVIKNAVEAT